MRRKYIYLLLLIIFLPINSNCQWELRNRVSGVSSLSRIWFVNSNTGFSGGYPGKILKTTDAGFTWNLVYQQNAAGIFDIEFINESTGFALYNRTNLLKTTNGGLNWDSRYLAAIFNSIYFLNENVGFLTPWLSYKLWKTTNAGVNWFQLNYSFYSNNLYDAKFFNNDTGFVCGRYESGNGSAYIGKTTNGGMNWTGWTFSPGYEYTNLSFISPEKGFVSELFGLLLKTTNGGQNFGWFVTNSFPSGSLKVQAIDSNIVYVGGGNGYFSKSTNGGTNWSQMYSPVINHIYDMQFLNKDTGYACGDSGIVLRITNASTVGINQTGTGIISDFELYQNYPNPFNPTTLIKYDVKKNRSSIKLVVYDVLGNEVVTLVNERQNTGNYTVEFNGSNYTSGIYFYTIQAGSFNQTKKMLLIK